MSKLDNLVNVESLKQSMRNILIDAVKENIYVKNSEKMKDLRFNGKPRGPIPIFEDYLNKLSFYELFEIFESQAAIENYGIKIKEIKEIMKNIIKESFSKRTISYEKIRDIVSGYRSRNW